MEDKFVHHTIGYMKTCYSFKNGTPRQPTVTAASKGSLKILKHIFNNPNHSIEGLIDFSHVWILFVFHLNKSKSIKAKVKPPRLNGSKTGVFSTRSPHRPNSIGLTLAKLDYIDSDTIYFSGLDIVDGTPILDIKPYIPQYDMPSQKKCKIAIKEETSKYETTVTELQATCDITEIGDNAFDSTLLYGMASSCADSSLTSGGKNLKTVTDILPNSIDDYYQTNNSEIPNWIEHPPIGDLQVVFSCRANDDMKKFKAKSTSEMEIYASDQWVLELIQPEELQNAIFDILKADPRSTYRRTKCKDRLYYFTVDKAHVTAWFDESCIPNCVEVLRVIPKTLDKDVP